jgi:hypothetical protein
MTAPISRLSSHADALHSAAQQVHDAAMDRSSAPSAPAALHTIEDALTVLSRACHALGHTFVPLGEGDDTIAGRYARAGATWPAREFPAGPAYEQQARVLSSLHDAAATLRSAAHRCARAADNLALTMRPLERAPRQRHEQAA